MALTVGLMETAQRTRGKGRRYSRGEGHRGAVLVIDGNGWEGGRAVITWRNGEGNRCSAMRGEVHTASEDN